MSFWVSLFRTSLRAQLSSLRNWVLLALLPLLAFGALSLMPAEEVSAPVQVGVVLPAAGGGDFWRYLEERDGLVVAFHAAPLDRARQQVAAGRWDCALVLPEDLQARLDRGELEGLFTLLISPGSTVYPLVRETAASCAARCVAPNIAEDYLLSSGILDRDGLAQARPRLQAVLSEQERVLVSLETVDGGALDPIVLADRGVSRLLSGLTAILLLIWALFAAMDLGRWLDSPFVRRLLPLRGAFGLTAVRLGAALVPALAAGALALLAVEQPLACILALIPYLLFWGAAALALARVRSVWSALPVVMPFVPALGLLLSPALLDVTALVPALAPVARWNPITLYLRACGGHWGDGMLLAAAGGVVLLLLWARDRRGPASGAGNGTPLAIP